MILAYPFTYYGRSYREWLNRSRLRIAVPARGEQISVAEAALHCRIDAYGSPAEYEEQAWLESAIVAAREYCEGWTGLALVPQTFELAVNGFPYVCDLATYWAQGYEPGIGLQVAPIIAVQTVVYTDTDGATQTTYGADWLLDEFSAPGVLHVAYGGTWPTARAIPNAVRITFDAGYALPGDSPSEPALPYSIRQAMLLVIGHMYEHRESVTEKALHELEMGALPLLERYRIRTGMA